MYKLGSFLIIGLLFITEYSCKKDFKESEYLNNSEVMVKQEWNKNFKSDTFSIVDKALREEYLNSGELIKSGQLESRSSTLYSPITV